MDSQFVGFRASPDFVAFAKSVAPDFTLSDFIRLSVTFCSQHSDEFRAYLDSYTSLRRGFFSPSPVSSPAPAPSQSKPKNQTNKPRKGR